VATSDTDRVHRCSLITGQSPSPRVRSRLTYTYTPYTYRGHPETRPFIPLLFFVPSYLYFIISHLQKSIRSLIAQFLRSLGHPCSICPHSISSSSEVSDYPPDPPVRSTEYSISETVEVPDTRAPMESHRILIDITPGQLIALPSTN
jgi:hypothetical protein